MNTVFEQMEVMHPTRQRTSVGRWKFWMSQALPDLNQIYLQLLDIAGKSPRNTVFDEVNISKNARRRIAGAFQAFGTRRCVTIVTDEKTLSLRKAKRERMEQKILPLQFNCETRVNFDTPVLEEGFTILEWPELPESQARARITVIRREGFEWRQWMWGTAKNWSGVKGKKPKSDVPYDFSKPNPPENECQLFVEGNQYHMRVRTSSI